MCNHTFTLRHGLRMGLHVAGASILLLPVMMLDKVLLLLLWRHASPAATIIRIRLHALQHAHITCMPFFAASAPQTAHAHKVRLAFSSSSSSSLNFHQQMLLVVLVVLLERFLLFLPPKPIPLPPTLFLLFLLRRDLCNHHKRSNHPLPVDSAHIPACSLMRLDLGPVCRTHGTTNECWDMRPLARDLLGDITVRIGLHILWAYLEIICWHRPRDLVVEKLLEGRAVVVAGSAGGGESRTIRLPSPATNSQAKAG
jgi:hypothetical protein